MYSVNAARRELRVKPYPAFAGEFDRMKWVRLVPTEGAEVRCKVEAVQKTAEGVIVRVMPGVTRDTVARLKAAAVVVRREELQPRKPGEIDAAALVGMTIVEANGARLGKVTAAYETPAHTVAEIERPDGGAFLLPMVAEVLVRVDWEQGTIAVNDIGPYAVENEG